MLMYILKFSVCLFAFIAFYKVFLEQTSYNQFKRYYLIFALFTAICIPFITFIEYIEPQFTLGDFNAFPMVTEPNDETLSIKESTNYLPIILWSIYGLGVLIFSVKFLRNLIQLVLKIKVNPKRKTSNFINVLLQDLVVPHTFFNYIFLNKVKFENNQIPREVLLHEETHAKQKHSLDVLFIEVIQILLWFNPLIYLVKKDMKLNHEFLADQAVIQQGIQPAKYQELLLAFSSNASDPQLANAINYSSIKKRLTVMKTQTKKRALWLRSLVLMPLLAVLVYSFSSRELIEREVEPTISVEDATLINTKFSSEKGSARSIDIEVLDNGQFIIDNFKATKKTFTSVINTLHQDITPEVRNKIMNIHVSSSGDISNEDVWFIYNSLLDYGFHRMVTDNQEIILSKGNTPFAIENNNQASYNELVKYNKLAKLYNKQPEATRVIPLDDLKQLETIYRKMSKDQKDNAQPFPNCPPENIIQKGASKENIITSQQLLPTINGISCDDCTVNLSRNSITNLVLGTTTNEKITSFKIKFPKKPVVTINSNSLNQQAKAYLKDAKIGNAITIFDMMSNKTSIKKDISIQLVIKHDKKYSDSPIVKKGEVSNVPPPPPKTHKLKGEVSNIPPPPPPIPANASAQEKAKYKKVLEAYDKKYRVVKGKITDNPPPPPPKSPLDHVIDMAKKGATFYLEGKEVSSDRAIDALKKNSSLNIESKSTNSKRPKVYITKKPIIIKH